MPETPRPRRYRTVRIRRPHEIAEVRDRHEHGGGDQWAPTVFVAILLGVAVAGVAILSGSGTGEDGEAGAADVTPSVRALDSRNHVVFRRTGRSLTIKIGQAAPRRLRSLDGAVRLECLHLAAGGTEQTYQRRLTWPEGSRFNTLRLPGRAAAALRECSLSRGGRTLARATF